ncbi:hypothetical protein AB1Y20_020761 [Prymnesium parvum]|uniref:Uncharacterized protein n=1 Tax=Prymnesium parvum TaxID=97485 RepID=A0AB34JW60_PRYPA
MHASRLVACAVLALRPSPLAASVGHSARAAADVSLVSGCATVDAEQSSSWKDSATNEDRFSLRLILLKWEEALEVTLTWGTDVQIDEIFEAEPISGGDGGRTVTLRPSSLTSEVVVAGRGTLSKDPQIMCSVARGDPETSESEGCSLGPHYHVLNSWQEGANIEVQFDTWEYHRIVSLIFDEEVEALNPLHATLEQPTDDAGKTILRFRLELQEGAQPCSTGHLDQFGNPERDTECKEAHPSNSPQTITFQIMPPPSVNAPRIICNSPVVESPYQTASPPPAEEKTLLEDASTTLPSLQLSPPPNPPPVPQTQLESAPQQTPLPAQVTVLMDPVCPLGGEMTVPYALHGSDHDTLRVIVQSKRMREDHQFVVGFVGLQMAVSHVAGASFIMDYPSAIMGVAHEYAFVPEAGALSFAFTVRGSDVFPSFCSCRLTNVPSTPASNVESQHDMEQAVPTEAERENPHPLLENHDQQQYSSQQPRAVDMTLIIIVGCVLLTLGIAAGAAWYYRTRCADGHHVGSIRSTAIDDGTAAQAIDALELELDDA